MSDQESLINLKKCPMHMPNDWTPPVPAYSAKIDITTRAVVLYVGIQRPTSESLSALNSVISKNTIPHSDLAMFTDRSGHSNYVLIAYFKSSPEHVQWEDASGFSEWWDSDEHLEADYGLWMERYAFEPGQYETLFSTPDSPEGVANHSDEIIGPIREHAYWGGAEDRIPNSGNGSLQTSHSTMPGFELSDTLGKRIVVKGPANLCLIRSGQDLTGVGTDERNEYDRKIEPALSQGLKFLADNPNIGCFESRYMRHCDAQGTPISKTFGMQLFLSIKHMQEWAKSHPTHLKIFNSFQKMAMERQGEFDLRLWHEVAVMGEGDSYAEYINCEPQTGFLPYAAAL